MDERFLIIDTSQRQGQVAVANGSAVLDTRHLQEARRHARDLAPSVKALLQEQGWQARELTGIFVARGPGSYTGLRVGLISAKILAYAIGCPLLGIDTFSAIACQVPGEPALIEVIADAQQGKVYAQRFDRRVAGELTIVPFLAWSATVSAGCVVTGPGLELYAANLPAEVCMAGKEHWLPRPESTLKLALERRQRGQKDDPFALEPLYLRVSSAEELFLNRQKASPSKA